MRVALDEQIFAVQVYGGISRLFYKKAKVFLGQPSMDVNVAPLKAPIINEYVLNDQNLASHLEVWRSSGPYRSLFTYLTRQRSQAHADIVHNTFYLLRGLSEHKKAKRVVTVYDMIPELFPGSRRRLDFLTRKMSYVRNADHIVCISKSTRNDLLRSYPEIKTPISIAYPGVDDRFHPDVAKINLLPENYILHVGNRTGYKDGVTLLKAFTHIACRFSDYTLLLVGGGPLTREERAIIAESKLNDHQVQQLSLSDSSMPSAYANAAVTIFPSRYEGFGLPAVEAMAAGSPLILAETSSLPEVGGNAAVYFSPGDHRLLAMRIRDVLSDFTQQVEMSQRGVNRARQFTWTSYAQANANAYQEVLG